MLAGRADEIKDTVAQAIEDLDATLALRAGQIGEGLVARVNEISVALASRLAELDGAINGRGQQLQAALAERSGDLRELFETQGWGLVEQLSARGGEIAREMTNVGEIVTQTIEGRGTAIVQHLGQKQSELTEAIERSSAQLRFAVEAGATASIAALIEANQCLKTEMADIVDRLGGGAAALREAVGSAGVNLTAVEQSLSDRMDDFRALLANITSEVQQFNRSAGETLGEAGGLAESIARHRDSLAASAGELAQSQTELGLMLDGRRNSLEALLRDVKDRRDDFENVMVSFTSLVAEFFDKAEARARDIVSVLAETSESAGGAIDQQFAEIRANIAQERERVTAALRAASAQASDELESILGRTTERFQTAASELREMSRKIQHELEATREALRANTADLPQETAQQAAAMRRVVADQIKALEELSEIVTRSGRAFDVSSPVAAGADRASLSAGPRRAEPPRSPELPRAAPAEAAQPDQRLPRAPSRPATGQTAQKGGWLSDLLARASSEEPSEAPKPAAKPAQPAQALEPLSLDVARMIDPDAAAEAWERYRRGEANAFSRRIYIGRGPQTFDEVRRRYRLDPEFHATVDRYVQEFERLLAEVGRDHQDDAAARTYLTSETGKVYTMLAHAAGRLG